MQARTPDGFEAPMGAAGNGKTAQSYIAGIGASGALLAGAVVTFVFLVGTVSFEVWPAASDGGGTTNSLGVAELNGAGGDGNASATLGTTVALIADSVPSPDVPAASAAAAAPVKAGGGLQGAGGGTDEDSGGSDGGSTGGNTGDGDGGTAGGDPGPGNGGNNGGANDPSDRPGHSDPRPSDAPGTGTGTASGPPAGGGHGSDRPSAGDRGRG